MKKTSLYDPQDHIIDKEVSFVDIASILVSRWKIMTIIFLLVVLAALAYALAVDRSYGYVSIYQVAEQEPGNALEAPSSVVAKVSNLYIGAATRELREEAGLERLPFDVEVGNPSDTLLIRLVSEAKKTDSDLVNQMHKLLEARIIEGENERVEKHRASLEQQLQSTERVLNAAEQSNSENAADLIANYTDRLANTQQKLSELREGQTVQVAVQSLEPVGTSRKLIMGGALVLGGMLAIMSAFLLHFVMLVRNKMSEEV